VIQPLRTVVSLDPAPRAGYRRAKRPAPGRSADARWIEAPDVAPALADIRRDAGTDGFRATFRYDGTETLPLIRLAAAGLGRILLPVTATPDVRGWSQAARSRTAAPAAGGDGGHHHGRGTGSRGKMGAHYPAMARVFPAALPMLRYISALAVSQTHADSKCQASGNAGTPPASRGTERPYLDRLRQDPISVGIRTGRFGKPTATGRTTASAAACRTTACRRAMGGCRQ
jgi:hypothetical protein